MGFTQDNAATSNSDFLKYAFDQQVTSLLRDSNTFTELHKGAVNLLIRDLRGRGYDASLVTNTEDFKAEIVYWVLWQIFDGQARGGNDRAARSAERYEIKWREQVKTRVYQTSDDGNTRGPRSAPLTLNIEGGSYFAPTLEREDGHRVGKNTFSGFDDIVLDKPD